MNHPLAKTTELVFACKKCKKVFRKEMGDYDEADEYCPQYKINYILSCDNHYVIPAITEETKEIDQF